MRLEDIKEDATLVPFVIRAHDSVIGDAKLYGFLINGTQFHAANVDVEMGIVDGKNAYTAFVPMGQDDFVRGEFTFAFGRVDNGIFTKFEEESSGKSKPCH